MEKPPWTKNTCLYFPRTQRAREYFNMVGNVLLTLVYTCLMGRFGTEPLAPSLLRHLLTSSMTLESTPLCVVVSRTAPLLGERHRLKSSDSIAPGTSLELVPALVSPEFETLHRTFQTLPVLLYWSGTTSP